MPGFLKIKKVLSYILVCSGDSVNTRNGLSQMAVTVKLPKALFLMKLYLKLEEKTGTLDLIQKSNANTLDGNPL